MNPLGRILLLAALAMLSVTHARAATVAILQPASDAPEITEALFRLKGELLAVGLGVAVTDRPPERDTESPEARAWLEGMASERGFAAVLDVIGDRIPVAVDVWVKERAATGGEIAPAASTQHALGVTRVALEADAQNRAETLTIRALEVLRARFVVIDWTAQPPASAPAVEPRPAPEKTPLAPLGPLGLEAGLSARTSLDDMGLLLLPLARFDWALEEWLALRVTGAASAAGATLESEAGSVHVAQQFALLGLSASPSWRAGIEPLFALSAGALRTAIEGQASSPHRGHRLDGWAFVVDGSAGVSLRLSDRYFLTIAAHAQLAEPRVAVHVVDEVVATIGGPTLLFALTLGTWL